MKRQTYNQLVRLLAGLGASMILVGATTLLPENMGAGNDIYAQSSGIPSKAVVMDVNGEPVTSEEYLYYLSQEGLNYYYYMVSMGSTEVPWETYVDAAETTTLEDVVRQNAQSSVVQNALIRKMAADNGIEFTAQDQESFRASVEEMKTTYGEDYTSLLASYGLTESLWETLTKTSTLNIGLQDAYVSGALRSDDAALLAMVEEHGLVMARSLLVPTAYLDDTGLEEAKASAEEYRRRILDSDDISAEIAAINTELGVSDDENVASLYHCGHNEDDPACATLSALEEGALSDVVETEEGFYLLLREPLDMDLVAQVQFSEDLEAAMDSAQVVSRGTYLSRLNLRSFIDSFVNALSSIHIG